MEFPEFSIRHNAMTITSIQSFAGIKGGFNHGCKDVYFIRCVGAGPSYVADIESMDRLLSEGEQRGRGRYLRLLELPRLADPSDISLYSDMFDTWERSGHRDLPLKAVSGDGQSAAAVNKALKGALECYRSCNPGASASMEKNFVIKLMFWADRAAEHFLRGWNGKETGKLVYSGCLKKQEYLFCYFLTLLGVDVLLLLPEGDADMTPGLLKLSAQQVLGECSGAVIPAYVPSSLKNERKPEQTGVRNKVDIRRTTPRKPHAAVAGGHDGKAAPSPSGGSDGEVASSGRESGGEVVSSGVGSGGEVVSSGVGRGRTAPSSGVGNGREMQPSSVGRGRDAPLSGVGNGREMQPSSVGRGRDAPPSGVGRGRDAPSSGMGNGRDAPSSSVGSGQGAPSSGAGNGRDAPPSGAGRSRELPSSHRELAQELAFEELAQLASSVVMITVHDRGGSITSTGSGIMIGRGGYILTNNHVASGGMSYSVRIEDDDKLYNTDEVIKYNQLLDLAIIRIDRMLKPIPVYKGAKPLARGQKVVAIGSPLGLFNSVSDGIISGFRNINDVDMIQFTAPISHGSSGGALLNMYGEVIGISTAGFDRGQNINLAVDYHCISAFVRGFV